MPKTRHNKYCRFDCQAGLAELPLDLEGDPYRDDEIGPWKVTRCCGAYLKGVEDGIVCRCCFGDGGDMYDGPAVL